MWWKDESGLRTCHVWLFDGQSDGRTKVTNIEVFDAPIVGIMQPIVVRNWQAKFDTGLDAFFPVLTSGDAPDCRRRLGHYNVTAPIGEGGCIEYPETFPAPTRVARRSKANLDVSRQAS